MLSKSNDEIEWRMLCISYIYLAAYDDGWYNIILQRVTLKDWCILYMTLSVDRHRSLCNL